MFNEDESDELVLRLAHEDAREVAHFRLARAFVALESINMHWREARRALRADRPKCLSDLFRLLQEKRLFRFQPMGSRSMDPGDQTDHIAEFLDAALEFAASERARRGLPASTTELSMVAGQRHGIFDPPLADLVKAPDKLDPLQVQLDLKRQLAALSETFAIATELAGTSSKRRQKIDRAISVLRKEQEELRLPTMSVLDTSERIERGVRRGLAAMGAEERGFEELRARVTRSILELAGLGVRRQRSVYQAPDAQLGSARKNRSRRKRALAKSGA
jgi:hypothetical protein